MDAPKGTSRAVAPKVVIANTRACLADSITGKRFQRCCTRYKNVGGIFEFTGRAIYTQPSKFKIHRMTVLLCLLFNMLKSDMFFNNM